MEQSVFLCVLILAALSSALDHSLITVSVPSVSGVLLLTGPKDQYQFDFSEASEACLFKNLSIATRSQVQTALDHGLEACRYGWISEKVAVLPRLSSVSVCGSGKTGVVTWRAELQRRFGVWCFSQSDSNEDEKNTTIASHTSTFYPTTTIPQRTTTFTTAATLATTAVTTITTTIPKTSQATRNPTTKPLTTARTTHKASTSAPWIQTTKKLKTAPSKSVSTQFTTRMSSKSFSVVLIHSLSTVGSTVRHDSSKPTISVKPPRQSALSTALIAFCIIVLVLSAGGAILYYKVSERWVWHHTPQKDDIEAETWKQTSSELELQEETEGEGEGRRFSSETMLYVNNDARTD